MSPLINRITSSFGFNSKKLISQVASAFSFTGGTPLTPGNGYRYHIFTASGPFTVTGSKLIDYVVVGGGGPGSNPGNPSAGGGGGAGGYRELIGAPITAGSYTVFIGPGASGGPSANSGIDGPGLFVFANGGGASSGTFGGDPGASGGGAPSDGLTGGAGNIPPVSPPQGNPGGSNQGSFGYGGAGGGGAGGSGSNRTAPGPLPLRRFGSIPMSSATTRRFLVNEIGSYPILGWFEPNIRDKKDWCKR